MPVPARAAPSTPSTAAPGYSADPVSTPTTPREYLSSPGTGVPYSAVVSASVQPEIAVMGTPYFRGATAFRGASAGGLALEGPGCRARHPLELRSSMPSALFTP